MAVTSTRFMNCFRNSWQFFQPNSLVSNPETTASHAWSICLGVMNVKPIYAM
jgi:hypothetical protein